MSTRRGTLPQVCVDPLSCLATGTRVNEINDFFQFSDLRQATKIVRIGGESNNASVYCLEYKKHIRSAAYIAYAVFKTTKDEGADNLAYEYVMGLYINELIRRHFPCFVQTYAMYRYDSADDKGRSRVTPLAGLHQCEPDVRESCRHNDRQCLLVQYLRHPKARTIGGYVFSREFVINDLAKILYQAYAVLAILCDDFTHYDMHTNNVMIYEMDKQVQFHYGKLSFCTRYITKIIDYGRAFGSPSILMRQKACNECNECGVDRGYWFNNGFTDEDYYINASQPNKSHDLLYLKQILKDRGLQIKQYNPSLYHLLTLVRYDSKFGTPPRESNGVQILNVVDAAKQLIPLIKHELKTGLTEIRVPILN